MYKAVKFTFIFLMLILIVSSIQARDAVDKSNKLPSSFNKAYPAHAVADHRVGQLQLTVSNIGTFGDGFIGGADFFTGQRVVGGIYPKDADVKYVFAGAFWIGAIVGDDTLVSTGADGWTPAACEFYPDEAPFGNPIRRSIIDPLSTEFIGAVSEEDFIMTYTDTTVEGVDLDMVEMRPHIPLNIKVNETSYAWSYKHSEDFVLFNYQITNIGNDNLSEVYLGMYHDGDVGYNPTCSQTLCYSDDITGFLSTKSRRYGKCDYEDSLNIAWIADNDGDFELLAPSVTGLSMLQTPIENDRVSYNWWISNGNVEQDFGPHERSGAGLWNDPFRSFVNGALGTPGGDRNKYYLMMNQEIDYDQAFTAAINADDPLWMYPNQALAQNFSNGYDTKYLLSFGPYDIAPGETLPLSFAYVAGEGFHSDPNNYDNNLGNGYNPDAFYNNLDFTDLAKNTKMASWVFDNPGVDTDGDGYFGKFHVCCDVNTGVCDTIYYEGDGVPDYNASTPLLTPVTWAEAIDSSTVRVRWNGMPSETMLDHISQVNDFEGYRVYFGTDDLNLSYIASYDIDDYSVYNFNNNDGSWTLEGLPGTIEELRCRFGSDCNDFTFNPNDFTEQSPLTFDSEVFYFVPFDLNLELAIETDIIKTYPNQVYPSSLNPEEADPSELTQDGYFKYFEYELIVEHLLPKQGYCFEVRAFDFGYPLYDIAPLESISNNTLCIETPIDCGGLPDGDGDGMRDKCDNCPETANAGQADFDNDGIGDACDICPSISNPTQIDSDLDNIGDICDNCPKTSNQMQVNSDGDSFGDACDNCPNFTNIFQFDTDADGLGNACDDDIDGDGILNELDNCPTRSNPNQEDDDQNGVGNACCCVQRGDIVKNGISSVAVDISDLMLMVKYFYGPFYRISCYGEYNINGDNRLNILDIVYLVDYMFFNGRSPQPCNQLQLFGTYKGTYTVATYENYNWVLIAEQNVILEFTDSTFSMRNDVDELIENVPLCEVSCKYHMFVDMSIYLESSHPDENAGFDICWPELNPVGLFEIALNNSVYAITFEQINSEGNKRIVINLIKM